MLSHLFLETTYFVALTSHVLEVSIQMPHMFQGKVTYNQNDDMSREPLAVGQDKMPAIPAPPSSS